MKKALYIALLLAPLAACTSPRRTIMERHGGLKNNLRTATQMLVDKCTLIK